MTGLESGDNRPSGIDGRSSDAYNLNTTEGRVAENEAREQRNAERRVQREAGNTGVEEDEPLLELAPLDTVHGGGGGTSGGENNTTEGSTERLGGGFGLDGEGRSLEVILEALKQEGDPELHGTSQRRLRRS
ncbi:hypothetical protein NUW54_g4218 [Trametes sanguinea]|uniref:Uncharacterized protein n=1 Tax=Trametes sanguinea TaxID=158606 RepID=A0ACC1Q071_9APHY|nr:hypothetical protein NUW54_g4218 [Trametes sanguinea]